MKNYIYILAASMLVMLAACTENDPINDDVIIGEMAPQLYWDVLSSTVTAGNNVPFTVQYYTTAETPISHLELWYNVVQEESKMVVCPWVETFSYSYTSTVREEKRISQRISEYPTSEDYWSDSLSAYKFNAQFPTSNTLNSISWMTPSSFDSTLMVTYFGAGFMQHFKDSLYGLMQFADFKRMYTGMALLDDFKPYTDSTYNDNSGQWDYHFPEINGQYPVPDTLQTIYNNIAFADLIFNASTGNYDVEFRRYFTLNAILKALDMKGIAGLGASKEITLN